MMITSVVRESPATRRVTMAEIDERTTKDGTKRFDVRFRVNGRQCKVTFKNEADAKKKKKLVEADDVRGQVTDPQGGERFFGLYAEEWLRDRDVKGQPLTPATRQGYEKLLRRNLNPYFDKTRLRQIDRETVRKWNAKLKREKGGDQAAKSYRLMRAILNTAVDDQLLPETHRCVLKGAGVESRDQRSIPDEPTVHELADAIDPRLRVLVFMTGYLGFRTGELIGLQRKDINLLKGTVSIERQLHEISGKLKTMPEGTTGGRVMTGPKSEAGNRTRYLFGDLADEVSDHLDRYVRPEPDAPVFASKSGLALRRADLSAAWRSACLAVGLIPYSAKDPSGLRLYDLRHHALTLVAQRPGATLREIMVAGGHSSPRAALIYQHATEESESKNADFLAEQFAAAKKASKPA
jgi:integrase